MGRYKTTVDEKLRGELPLRLIGMWQHNHQPPIARASGLGCHQFIWVSKGSGRFQAGGETRFLTEGEGLFTRAGVPHAYSGEELYTSWCTFTCDETFLDYILGDRTHLFFEVPRFLDNETEALVEFANSASSTLALSAAGYAYVVNLFEAIVQETDPILSQVQDYLEQHYREPISLDDIAESVGMNRFSLCRYCRNRQAVSVMKALKALRIAKAKRMLNYTTLDIAEIATLCGFGSPAYFAKIFREECHTTPGNYRKMRRG